MEKSYNNSFSWYCWAITQLLHNLGFIANGIQFHHQRAGISILIYLFMKNGTENTFQKTPINPQGQQFIRVQEKTWKNGLVMSNRTGFLEVDPTSADEHVAALKNGTLPVTFGSLNRQTGLYSVQVAEAAAEA